jgi:hypothetical protein
MKTEAMAMVVDGNLKLDAPLDLSDQVCVSAVVEPLENWKICYDAGLDEWKE